MRVAAALLVLLAACTPSRGREGVVELWGLGREGEVVAQLLPGFEREHPGIRVKVQQIPWTAAHEKLLTAFVGGATPDLAQIGNTWVPELAEIGALAPLGGRVAASAVVRAHDHFPGIWDTNIVDGELWGVPWYVDTRVLFYRTDLLARAGFAEFPRTWEEWRRAMRAVKERAGARDYAIFLPTDEWAQPVFLAMQKGATLITDDARAAFTEPAFEEAFRFYVSLYHEGLAPIVGNTQAGNYYQRFGDGWVAMYPTGPWNLGEFRTRLGAAREDDWSTAPLPAPTAAEWPGVSLAGGASLVVFAGSRRQDEAWKVIEYLSRPEQQVEFYRLLGDMPANRHAWEHPLLAGDPKAAAFRTQLERVRPLPKIPESERIVQHLWEVAEEAIRGRRSVEAVLARLDRDVDAMLDKRRWLEQRRTER